MNHSEQKVSRFTPVPDERHIRYADVYELRPAVSTRFNIEGYPSEKFLDMVLKVKPTQVTLVPMHTMSLHQMQVGTPKTTSIFFPKWSTFVNQREYTNLHFRRTGFRDSRIRRKNRSRPYRIIYRGPTPFAIHKTKKIH